jgi:hypothetical protein
MPDAPRPARLIVATVRALLGAALGCAFLLASACTGDPPRVDDALVARGRDEDPSCDAESLAHGRQLFLDHCDACHALYSPDSRPRGEWPHEMAIMGRKAHLAQDQERDILRYILAARTPTPSAAASP